MSWKLMKFRLNRLKNTKIGSSTKKISKLFDTMFEMSCHFFQLCQNFSNVAKNTWKVEKNYIFTFSANFHLNSTIFISLKKIFKIFEHFYWYFFDFHSIFWDIWAIFLIFYRFFIQFLWSLKATWRFFLYFHRDFLKIAGF